MRHKEENYAYLDDKDVLTDDVLADVFDDREYTFGNPDKEAVGFILGYPFYATYSDCSNELTLKCCKHITEPTSLNAIMQHIEEQCSGDPSLRVNVCELHPCEWHVYFYFKDTEN